MQGFRAAILTIAIAGLVALPAAADTYSNKIPQPGTLNYVEGQASIGSQSITSKSAGSVELHAGQTLTTQQGQAEILLTPDVMLRVAPESSVKMISPTLTNTEVAVKSGDVEVEVDHLFKQNRIVIREDGAKTRLQKDGVYDFNAGEHEMRVVKGQALVMSGDKLVKVKGSHEVALNSAELKAKKFDKGNFEASDELYQWGKLRADYTTEAEMQQNPGYAWGPYMGWGPGWGWGWGPGWWGGWGAGWWW